FTSYIYRAVQNRCLNYIKHKKVENAYVDYLVRHNLLDDQDYQERTINSYTDKELAAEIRDAISKLPEKCREIFTLSRFGNLSYKQIAAKLSISPKTVENQMGIALNKLRQVLKDFLYLFF
ncbi:MAG: sigma-70 family RNA polymerase sigma factor, partial [Bacteroidetes bacterium]|nr:sigma-70 family RNA polymerase sigma factor [Bacteroidota bacterium]